MSGSGFLGRLGLDRPELRAWAMYDWANSAFMATVLQVFPIFFVRTAAADLAPEVARARFAFFTSAAVIIVGLIGPLLGAIADHKGNKKGFLAAFLTVGLVRDRRHVLHRARRLGAGARRSSWSGTSA